MRIGIPVGLLIVVCTLRLVNSAHTYFYEKLNHFGLGKPIILRRNVMNLKFNRAAYPEPLPTPRSLKATVPTPYKTVYQGNRVNNDTRVFRRRFDFEPIVSGHQVLCEGFFDCTLTHLAIETSEAIPYIIRGGAGYRHFSVVVKARPGNALKGTVRAYCRKRDVDLSDPYYTRRSYSGKRRFRHDSSASNE